MICHRRKEVSVYHMQKCKGTSHESCIHYVDKNNPYYRRFASIYHDIKKRTSNPKSIGYKNYGGRGIKLNYDCLIDFYDDMFDSYVKHVKGFGERDTTIDRIDVNGNYEPGNVRWATRQEQCVNTRRKRKVKAVHLTTRESFEFDSPRECADALSLNLNSMYNALNNHVKSYSNYYFEYI